MEHKKDCKTILITGGAGFIGSHLCKKYLDENHRVICVDNLQTTQTPKNIESLIKNNNFKFIKHDIIKPLFLNEKVDWIFNLACSGSYTSYQFDPIHTMKTNTTGVINMLELAKKNNARILQASTSEIYGDPLETPQSESYKGNVNTIGPRACYDEGKRAAETLFMDYHREYGIDIRIIRIFNTYGPNMDPNDGRAITNFIMNAISNRDISIYGDGTNTRSFQYIDDLVSGIDKMMHREGLLGPINLGNPEEFTMQELADLVLGKIKSKSKIIHEKGATDDPKKRRPDISLAEKELSWKPEVQLSEGLDKTIEYFKNVDWAGRKVLVFATTYYPDMGPAEKALWELSKEMPETEFHIVTTHFKKGLPSFERFGTDSIYRVGLGYKFDKFLLPLLGSIKAYRLQKEHGYRFAWSIMGSYGGMTALIFKALSRNTNFLLSLDENELECNKVKKAIKNPLYRLVFSGMDTVYVSNALAEKNIPMIKELKNTSFKEGDTKSFVRKVRLAYADLLNKQERKLSRPR